MGIPIIDIFAGPGGLGEGFSSLVNENNERLFEIKLSIEKNPQARETLKLRSFFRQFKINEVPNDYYEFIRGELKIDELYKKWPKEAILASEEAWCATLGVPDIKDTNGASNEDIDARIHKALAGEKDWLLIGGPPCQAYSLVGRSRRKEKILSELNDNRVGLYKEYLRIIAIHSPAVFVMENVKGLLSAKTEEDSIFARILNDLSDPVEAYVSDIKDANGVKKRTKYKIYSLTTKSKGSDIFNNPEFDPKDFIIKAEEYGIPQKRHRVILLGIREDNITIPEILEKKKEIILSSIIGNLPKLRSGITREYTHTNLVITDEGKSKKSRRYNKLKDSFENWATRILRFNDELSPNFDHQDTAFNAHNLPISLGKEFLPYNYDIPDHHPLHDWYKDVNINGILHHVSRKHLVQDLKRYLFAARYTDQYGTFPRLEDYKRAGNDLLPDHENVDSGKFTDRFRVQLPNIAATTITSHISKDGHYFIHYDIFQTRSLTVREAARIQTFPDNYYFCGGRTEQYHQVGNAVPPYLAYQIAEIVHKIFISST